MILYNVTVSVDASVEHKWLQWMKEVHIPEMMETGCFLEHRVLKLIPESADDGITYAIQYFAQDSGMIDQYLDKHAPRLRQTHMERFGHATAAFRTLLEVV